MQTEVIHIHGNDLIENIQNQISNICPSMRIRFFRELDFEKHPDQCVMFSSNVRVRSINPSVKDFEITIQPRMLADELEKAIQSNGLPAQVFNIIEPRK